MDALFSIVPLIVFFPLLGVLINAFFGRNFMADEDSIGPGVFASLMAGLSLVVAVLMLIGLLVDPSGAEVPFLKWSQIDAGGLLVDIRWTFLVDTLSVIMMLVVTGVGTLIHIYAIGYMRGDARFPRFFTYMNLFLASMLILVTGANYLMLFVGWELVGLCSFLLIGFWFDRSKDGAYNSYAAKKAFVVNRVGDFGMILAIFLIFWTFGTLNFGPPPLEGDGQGGHGAAPAISEAEPGVFALAAEYEAAEREIQFGSFSLPFAGGFLSVTTIVTLLLLLGATGKSAQIPLFVWLPDAMAGPTPVSALIHAATMVTAGIYMITRSNVLYAMAPISAGAVAIIGGATALLAATIAVAQYDIKRVLAYSTISQLGFMIAAVGMGAYVAGMFHLATHAFFKALLFLSAGSVIHGMHHGEEVVHHSGGHIEDDFDPQDMRFMGGLRKHMPTTTWVYIVGALALAGIPPLAGFWSKDEILADASHANVPVYILLTIAAFFTAFYMGRQVFLVFYGGERSDSARHGHESPRVMTIPLVALALLSIFGGLMNLPFEGLHQLASFMERSVVHAHAGEFVPSVAAISTVLALIAIFIAWVVYGRQPVQAEERDPLTATGLLFTMLNNKWYVDEIYNAVFVNPFKTLGNVLAIVVDGQFWHDFFHDGLLVAGFNGWSRLLRDPIDLGVVDGSFNRLAEGVQGSAQRLRRVQTGYVRNYALAVALGVVGIVAYL
ncbi:MAG: NADH-quinone oxidoreductase subunit L, partial [Anaerolineae bacterium]